MPIHTIYLTMRHLLTFYLLLITTLSYSQVQLIDESDNNPVAFAHCFVDEGKIGITSDINGVISLTELKKNIKSDDELITIQHIGYENLQITLNELVNKKTVSLIPRTYLLDEAVVKPQKDDYLVIKAYFRGYTADDGIFKDFSDGFVEYYIPYNKKSKRKSKIYYKFTEYRNFRNQALIDKYQEKKYKHITVDPPAIYNLTSNTIVDGLKKKKYSFIDNTNGQDIFKSNSKVGYIKHDKVNGYSTISVDKIAPLKEKVVRIFGYEIRNKENDETVNYILNETNTFDIKDLISIKLYSKASLKNIKKDIMLELEGISEIYVVESRWLSKEEVEKMNLLTSRYIPESHSYKTNYWENLDKYNIPSISDNVNQELGKTLIMY